MAILRLRRGVINGNPDNLPQDAFEGELLLALDTEQLYASLGFDSAGAYKGNIKISDVVTVGSLPSIAKGVSDKLYVLTTDNSIHRFDAAANAYVQLSGAGGTGGATSFKGLSDTPTDYVGFGGFALAVKSTADGVEFIDLATIYAKKGDVYTKVETYSKTEADAKFSLVEHTHEGLHTHANKPVLDAFSDDGSGLRYNGSTISSDAQLSKYATKSELPSGADQGDIAIVLDENNAYQKGKAISDTPANIKLTDQNLPAPYAVTQSSAYPTMEGWKAFQGLDSGRWATSDGNITNQWVQIDLGSPFALGGYQMFGGTQLARTPKNFKLLGSNTGAFAGEEVIVDTRTGITWTSNERKKFILPSVAKFRFYRLFVEANNGDATYIQLYNFQLFSADGWGLLVDFNKTIADALYQTKGSYALSNHTHDISGVNGLQSALEGKASANHTHAELHAHANKSAIDRLGVNAGGTNLTIDGVEVASGGASKLTDLTDVNTSSATEGQALIKTASGFAFGDVATGSVSGGNSNVVYDIQGLRVTANMTFPTKAGMTLQPNGKVAYVEEEGMFYVSAISTQKNTPNMTSNTAPAPYVISTSSVYSTTFPSWKLMDSKNSVHADGWVSASGATSGWAKIDFGSQRPLGAFSLEPRNVDGDTTGAMPKVFRAKGSNDNTNWVTLGEYNYTDYVRGSKSTFDITPGNYRYFMIEMDNVVNSALTYIAIGEWEVYDIAWSKIANTVVYQTGNASETFEKVIAAGSSTTVTTNLTNPIVGIQKKVDNGNGTFTYKRAGNEFDYEINGSSLKLINNSAASETLKVTVK